MKPKLLKAVLFDIDGTLIDSNREHAAAWREALANAGHKLPFEPIRRAIGMGADKLLPDLVDIDSDSAEGKRIAADSTAIFEKKYLPHLQPFPLARELVARVCEKGLKVGVATSAEERILEQLLEIADIADLIDRSTSTSEVERSKPDSDVISAAAAAIDVPLSAVYMIGDSPYDIEAARRVGVGTIALTCGGWTADELSRAIAIYRDPAHLIEQFERSPLHVASLSYVNHAPLG